MHAAFIPAIILFAPWVVVCLGVAYSRVVEALTRD